MTATGTSSSDEEHDGSSVPRKRFRVGENEPIDKSSSTNGSSSAATSIEPSSMSISSSSSTATVVEVAPKKNKLDLKYGFISMIGRRRVMEDAITAGVKLPDNGFEFFAAYDGHGGSRVSHACRDRLHYILEKEILDAKRKANNNNDNDNDNDNDNNSGNSVDWERVMVKCFSNMDDEVRREGNGVGGYEEVVERTAGSAAVAVIVGMEEVVVANCGDCRAILCNRGVTIPLSSDHKPDRPDEKKRIESAGGKILNWNGSRVQGVLATSRSIGDHGLKPFVIPEPEVTVYRRNEFDEFLVIATNGLWDVVSNEATCELVRKCLDGQIRGRFPGRDSVADAAAFLIELAIAKGSKDNISVIVVEL
ncbi:hypothetical protein HAX54_013933 [Datura stramonium]|uniref:PPM-type phosphatase domain-containing protein n=1 Tax=Datura stramonium TaxID=4076 RepID=A0ABS8Y3Z3_DATST|nr:hypothetical protein [Datura stramonium]